jgi:hypothetical protein
MISLADLKVAEHLLEPTFVYQGVRFGELKSRRWYNLCHLLNKVNTSKLRGEKL